VLLLLLRGSCSGFPEQSPTLEDRIMARRKKTTLWDSTVRALGAMEQALEVFHGARIRFVDTMEIEPGKKVATSEGRDHLITVQLDTAFVGRQWYPFMLSVLGIDLVKIGDADWEATRAHFHVQDPHQRDSKGSYYYAHWRRARMGVQKVRIAIETEENKTPSGRYWYVGHTMADRVTEPITGRHEWPDWD
jgi:hypothetical protein